MSDVDPRVPLILHSVAAKMKAKADDELALAERRHAISMRVVEQTEAAAVRAERPAPLPVETKDQP